MAEKPEIVIPEIAARGVITRLQADDKFPQVLMIQKPSTAEWELPGGRLESNLDIPKDLAKIIQTEVGIRVNPNSLEDISAYHDGDWLTWTYLLQLLHQTGPLKVDLDRNQGVKWFGSNGRRLILESEQDDVLEAKYPIASGHHKMISDALKMIRKVN